MSARATRFMLSSPRGCRDHVVLSSLVEERKQTKRSKAPRSPFRSEGRRGGDSTFSTLPLDREEKKKNLLTGNSSLATAGSGLTASRRAEGRLPSSASGRRRRWWWAWRCSRKGKELEKGGLFSLLLFSFFLLLSKRQGRPAGGGGLLLLLLSREKERVKRGRAALGQGKRKKGGERERDGARVGEAKNEKSVRAREVEFVFTTKKKTISQCLLLLSGSSSLPLPLQERCWAQFASADRYLCASPVDLCSQRPRRRT